jgi:hypothetical protein
MAGVAFADTVDDATHKSTPVTTTLDANNNPDNPIPPQSTNGPADPDKSNNKNDNLNGNFGIAYQPDNFSFSANLGSGEQTIPITNTKNASYDVGVEDKKHDYKGWTLKASFVWNSDSPQIAGASIKTSTTGTVLENTNNSTTYNSAFLKPTTMKITEPTNLTINGTENIALNAPTIQTGAAYDSVYDLQLGNVSLVIPNAENVNTGTYSGNVNWNLEMAAN